jgi:hypothetical protein
MSRRPARVPLFAGVTDLLTELKEIAGLLD